MNNKERADEAEKNLCDAIVERAYTKGLSYTTLLINYWKSCDYKSESDELQNLYWDYIEKKLVRDEK